MEKLTNQVYELPSEGLHLLVMDFVNTIVDCSGSVRHPFKLRPGVRDFIQYHQDNGVPVVISSDAEEEHIQETIERLGIRNHINAIYGRTHMVDDITKDISRICKERGVAPEKTLMVGDIPGIDGESARKAGVKFLHVPMPELNDSFSYEQYLKREN